MAFIIGGGVRFAHVRVPHLIDLAQLEHALGDTEAHKPDCELRALARLSDRLKALFPRLPILLLLDGLYASGPVMQRCLRAHWQFMIRRKDQELPSVWQEFRALQALKPQTLQRNRGRRRQHFTWVNDIDCAFGSNGRQHLKLHAVVCEESGEGVDQQAQRQELGFRPTAPIRPGHASGLRLTSPDGC